MPTSGASADVRASQPTTGVTGSWTCTTSNWPLRSSRRSRAIVVGVCARLETAPFDGQPIVGPSGTSQSGTRPLLRPRAAVQPRGPAVVAVVRREHLHVVAGGEQLARQRLDVPCDPAGVRPRVGGDESYSHKPILRERTRGSGSVIPTFTTPNTARPLSILRRVPERHFVKYTFLKVDPAWRRLPDEQRAEDKREFLAACEDFAAERLLRAFSTVGTRGDTDLMLLTQATNLERIHEFHVVLAQSGLMKWCAQPYSYLAMTKPSEYSDESRLEVRPAHGRYLFVYPFVKTRAWYTMPADERWKIMQEHIRVGKEYPDIDLNTSYSFGLDDQEFVVAFETDEPARFLDLVQRLRTTEASAYTKRDTPTFTCVSTSVERALSALDGTPLSDALPAA